MSLAVSAQESRCHKIDGKSLIVTARRSNQIWGNCDELCDNILDRIKGLKVAGSRSQIFRPELRGKSWVVDKEKRAAAVEAQQRAAAAAAAQQAAMAHQPR